MSRRKSEITGHINERDFPHLVDLKLPPGGRRASGSPFRSRFPEKASSACLEAWLRHGRLQHMRRSRRRCGRPKRRQRPCRKYIWCAGAHRIACGDCTDAKARPVAKEETKSVPIVECPPELSPTARQEWDRLAPELAAAGRLTPLDRGPLAAYCTAYALWTEGVDALQRYGTVMKSPNGYPIQSLYLSIVQPLQRAVRCCWSSQVWRISISHDCEGPTMRRA